MQHAASLLGVGVMPKHLRSLVASLVLSHLVAIAHANTCVEPGRASVPGVCGGVINIAGEHLPGAELTLTSETNSATYRTTSDQQGRFSFGPLPKGDYLLRGSAPGFTTAYGHIRVSTSRKTCKPKLIVKLGFNSCEGGVGVKGRHAEQ